MASCYHGQRQFQLSNHHNSGVMEATNNLWNCTNVFKLLLHWHYSCFTPWPVWPPVTATAVETVAPTFTCCPLERRCTSSPPWSSCSMWTSSCRDTTPDTQMTSNGERHTWPEGLVPPHAVDCSIYHICHLFFASFPCWSWYTNTISSILSGFRAYSQHVFLLLRVQTQRHVFILKGLSVYLSTPASLHRHLSMSVGKWKVQLRLQKSAMIMFQHSWVNESSNN